jgi:putative transposase
MKLVSSEAPRQSLVRTARIKLDIPATELLPTVRAYTTAFNFVCKTGFDSKDKNGVSLHKKTYYIVKEYLPSQLACSSRMKAAEALKSVFVKPKKYYSCPKSKLCSIRYDVRSYSLFLDKGIISLLTISGRKRYPIAIPEFYSEYTKDWKHTSADLIIRRNSVFLHIVFEKDIADTEANGNLIGIDRGINNIAVVSNNKFYGGGKVKQIVKKRQRIRSKLQKKNSKSAKRHLRKLSGKERRFRADINHQISKEIVEGCKPGDTIILEKLTGIRGNKRRGKELNRLIHNWSFYQLEQFIKYKAAARGIKIEYVDARYTSQRCSKCGFTCRSNRKEHSFCCKSCNFKLNSDLNASRNICIKFQECYMSLERAVVDQPIVSVENEPSARSISDASQRLSVVGN